MDRGPIDVISAKLGQADAFARLVKAHQGLVCSVTLAATRNLAASEQLAIEVFVDAFKRLRELKRPREFRKWLLSIAREHTPLIGADDEAGEILKSIPSFTRESFVLYCREGASVHHVAEQLGLSIDEVRTQILLAREHVPMHVLENFADIVRQPALRFTEEVMAALPAATAPFAVPTMTSVTRDVAVLIAVVMIVFGTAWVRPSRAAEPEPAPPLRLLPNAYTPVTAGVRFSGGSFEGTTTPNAKVIVRLAGEPYEMGHALADNDGHFAVSGFGAGRYDVESAGVIRRGLALNDNERFMVTLDQSTDSMRELRGPTSLRGRVVTSTGLQPQRALIDVQSGDDVMRSEVAQASFTLPRLPAGDLAVRAIVDGEVGLVRTGQRELTVYTCAPAAITGTLEPGAIAELVDSAVPRTRALEDGSFYLTDVPAGTFMLRTGAREQWVTIGCGEVLVATTCTTDPTTHACM